MNLSVVTLTDGKQDLSRLRASLPPCTQHIICVCKQDKYAVAPKVVKVAEEQNVIILNYLYYNFERHFDFSEARNFASEFATGKFIFHIDSDEWIGNPPEYTAEYIQALTESPAHLVYISISGVGVPQDDRPRERYCLPSLRLYRNGRNIRWVGICHEYIKDSDFEIADSELILLHDGYTDQETMLGKAERNAKLLIREYVRDPSSRNWEYLKRTFSNLLKR